MERARAETALQEERDRLTSLIDAASSLEEVWFADGLQTFTLANPSAIREFDLDPTSEVNVESIASRLEVFRPDGSPRPVEEAPPLRALRGRW